MDTHLRDRYRNIAVANAIEDEDAANAWDKLVDLFFAWSQAKCCGGFSSLLGKQLPLLLSSSATSGTDEEGEDSSSEASLNSEFEPLSHEEKAHRRHIKRSVLTWCQTTNSECATLMMDEAVDSEWEDLGESCRPVDPEELLASEPESYFPDHLAQLAHRRIERLRHRKRSWETRCKYSEDGQACK